MVAKEVTTMGQVRQPTAFRLHSIRIGLSAIGKVLLVAAENITFHDKRIPLLPFKCKEITIELQ